ncbi:synaptic vesicle 2-related protein [Plakobranchus ocellatus]|uniref:Synaptic vesicle 2-related protein n=1 Tax=Plakobranchus ocellatus TaxID=259542 RepID=A0AAV4A442_9GAST|nr:synaptic vesicle 2-related protein [Plakobranchus ocellatus]
MTGMLLGSSFWGAVTDKYGRKTALTLAAILIGYFGFLSAFSPMYIWMAICRFLVGCSLAALPQTVVLYAEYLPMKARTGGLLLLAGYWAIGATFEVILAMLVMPTLGWRYLMAFSAMPVVFFPIFNRWMPESARFYLACGRYKEADAMLQMVAKDNRKPMLEGRLSSVDVTMVERGRVKDMLKPPHRTLSCLLNCLWFVGGLLYHGIALLLPTLLNKPDGCHGLLVAYVFMQYLGRKPSLAITNLLFAACLFICNICMTRLYLTGLMFVARAMIAGAFQSLFIYTAESYPTNIRAIGMGVAAGTAKVGSLITPFIAQVLIGYSAHLTFTLYGVMAVIAAVIALFLPFETLGRAMVVSSIGLKSGRERW